MSREAQARGWRARNVHPAPARNSSLGRIQDTMGKYVLFPHLPAYLGPKKLIALPSRSCVLDAAVDVLCLLCSRSPGQTRQERTLVRSALPCAYSAPQISSPLCVAGAMDVNRRVLSVIRSSLITSAHSSHTARRSSVSAQSRSGSSTLAPSATRPSASLAPALRATSSAAFVFRLFLSR